jgi:hypothetical protein
MVLVLLLCLASAIGCGGDNDAVSGSAAAPEWQTETVDLAPDDPASSALSWRDAAAHEGTDCTIEGPVVGTFYADSSNGQPTFLNVGRDYPHSGRFTVVIWGEDRGAFPEPPEDMYAGATIRVTGSIASYEGIPQMMVRSPSDIEVVH